MKRIETQYKVGDQVKVVAGGNITDDNDRTLVKLMGEVGEVVEIEWDQVWRDEGLVEEPTLMVLFPAHQGEYRPWAIHPDNVVLADKKG